MVVLDVMDTVAARLGLKVLCHEKPFKGVNGSGKHCNWSLATNTGKNVYAPGKTEESQTYFFAFVAALASAISMHGQILRVAVAHAGNDHRLGAQEAPPAIMSLYTGVGMEAHIRGIVDGGALFGYETEGKMLGFGSKSVEAVQRGIEDRNRTAPFPFCGNRFEFRAVGSSQSCAQPVAYLNCIVAAGCAALSEKIEGGMSPRDAVAATFKEAMPAIFNGNGYSAEWPVEAEARGLPNLKDTPMALATFNCDANKAVFAKMGVFTPEEVEARTTQMFDAYSHTLLGEAETCVQMANQLYIPALATDLKIYSGSPALAGDRVEVYSAVAAEAKALAGMVHHVPAGSPKEVADYFAYTVKPQMAKLRDAVDTAEGLCCVWPVPSYSKVFYSHHTAPRV
jgi:glutamine synthetase